MRVTTMTISMVLGAATVAAGTGAGCSSESPKEAPRSTVVAAPPAAPKPDAAAAEARPKMAANPDGLSLADRIKKKKADEEKLAAELATQEKDRLLAYDQGKAAAHTAVFAFIKKTRKQYDDTASKKKGKPDAKADIQKLADSLRKAIEKQGAAVKAIDPTGGNSNIVTDEDVMLNALANEYPAALQAAADGDEAPLKEQAAEIDRREKKIEEWLAEVKKAPKKK